MLRRMGMGSRICIFIYEGCFRIRGVDRRCYVMYIDIDIN